ncbi:MAG: TIGR00341 family protein [Acidobacteriia bacterium]|nr:TIGR00341 family protein [Terriglobia bacterium]
MEESKRHLFDPADAVYRHEEFHLPASERDKLYQRILESSLIDPEYLTMLLLAGLLALFGLLQNSVAVIIGAMLISPLMDPILAAALALLTGDAKLGRKTAVVLGLSIGAVMAITAIVAWLVPLKEVTPEILARTNPNLLDLFIAFLSGLAGTLALRAGSTSYTILPGVAIAVAVVPPLAVVGYSLSTRHGAMAWGGFLLFITNLVSIMLSAALVFHLMGFRPRESTEEGQLKLRKRLAISALVLAVLAVPLVQTLRNAVGQIQTRSGIESVLNRAFRTKHSSVTDLAFSRRDGTLNIHATIRTTEYFEDKTIAAVQEDLRREFGSTARLEVDQLLVTQGGLSPQQVARLRDFISGRMVEPVQKEPPFDLRATEERLISHLQAQLDEVLAGTRVQRALPLRAELGGAGPLRLSLVLTSPEPLEPQTVKLLAAQLSQKFSVPVALSGQVKFAGPDFRGNLQLESPRRAFGADERKVVGGLAGRVLAHPGLRLRTSVPFPPSLPEADRVTIEKRIERLVTASGLRPEQWTLERVPAAETPQAPATGKPSAFPLTVQLEVFQEF